MKITISKFILIFVFIIVLLVHYNITNTSEKSISISELLDLSMLNPENAEFGFANNIIWTKGQLDIMQGYLEKAEEKFDNDVSYSLVSSNARSLWDDSVFTPLFITTLSILILTGGIRLFFKRIFCLDHPISEGWECLHLLTNSILLYISAIVALRIVAPIVQWVYVYITMLVLEIGLRLVGISSFLAWLWFAAVTFSVMVLFVLLLIPEREVLYLQSMVSVKNYTVSNISSFFNVIFLILIAILAKIGSWLNREIDGPLNTGLVSILVTDTVLCLIVYGIMLLFSVFI